jgi:starch synthase
MRNKAHCKHQLQRRFGLRPDARATVMALGSRMTRQKMADVAALALPGALQAHPDLQVCILGHGDKGIERALENVGRRYPGRCAVRLGFQEPQAHLLHAGADILLHGSRFEPFGLTPLYAMRYGTIPIGSKVGGMADTIRDAGGTGDVESMRRATGVLFEGDTAADMSAAIDRAMGLRRHPEVWRAMQANAMRTDFSWSQAAPLYVRTYRSLCAGLKVNAHPRVPPEKARRSAAHADPREHIAA